MTENNKITAGVNSVDFSLDQCIKCNICTTVCPVASVTDLFLGPKYSAPQAGRFRRPDQPSPDISVDYCSGCRACNLACPTGVKIAEMNARARADMVNQGKIAINHRLRNNVVARAELLGKFAQPISPIANAIFSYAPARILAEKAFGISRHAPFPPFAKQRFTTWFNKQPQSDSSTRQVVLFHGCATEYYESRVGRAAVHVLQSNNLEVIVPPQNCCGLPLLSNGEFDAARKYHINNVRNLAPYARKGIPIVGTSTSCTLTLKEEAPELLDMYDEDTMLVANWTYDFNEFLLTLQDDGSLNNNFDEIPLQLPYHVPCQYKGHRLGRPGVEILGLIPELEIMESKAVCCGIAGTYGYKQEKYEISMAVGESLFEFIEETGAPLVVCDSETCRWQITHATGVPCIHPVELIATAYGHKAEPPLALVLKQLGLKSVHLGEEK